MRISDWSSDVWSSDLEYQPPLPFDQQPLEAHATVDACTAAYEVTGNVRWRQEAEKAFHWYLGRNDLDLPLATREDGGCYDGLMPNGVNRTQIGRASCRERVCQYV